MRNAVEIKCRVNL